jgi:hypothetical protein
VAVNDLLKDGGEDLGFITGKRGRGRGREGWKEEEKKKRSEKIRRRGGK